MSGPAMTHRTPMIYDMETGDPDDLVALAMLATHPKVDLRAVTIWPGDVEQVRIVRRALSHLGADTVMIGGNPEVPPKQRVRGLWNDIVPADGKSDAIEVLPASTLIRDVVRHTAYLRLVTGGPLTNIARAFESYPLTELSDGTSAPALVDWICQGGFAGANLVPEADRLLKFGSRITCPTYNFNGNPKATLALLGRPGVWGGFTSKTFVSKNVCHGFVADEAFLHEYKTRTRLQPSVHAFIYSILERFLSREGVGKKLHDPLAAAVAIHHDVCDFAYPVELYRERGEWGSRMLPAQKLPHLNAASISVRAHRDRFLDVLAACGSGS